MIHEVVAIAGGILLALFVLSHLGEIIRLGFFIVIIVIGGIILLSLHAAGYNIVGWAFLLCISYLIIGTATKCYREFMRGWREN